MRKRMLIFASGSKAGGGSGFENLVNRSNELALYADIVGVVSNYENGGVRARADRLSIPFVFFKPPFNAEAYQKIVKDFNPDLIMLSGWLKLAKGLDSTRTINIHPGPLPQFGGDGMYGHHVHEAVLETYHQGRLKETAVSMHFVTDKYDRGPLICSYPVSINKDDTVDSLQKRVIKAEHMIQPVVCNYVLKGQIWWDGNMEHEPHFPPNYPYL